jgi:hypothetical protein
MEILNIDGQIDTQRAVPETLLRRKNIFTQRPVPETLLGRDGQIATSCTGDVAEKVKRK